MRLHDPKRWLAGLGAVIGAAIVLCGSATADAMAADASSEPGWFAQQGRQYYRQADGTLCSGAVALDGVWYLFAPNGALQTGWQTVENHRFYYDPTSGAAVFGWHTWREECYYIDPVAGKCVGICTTDCGLSYFDAYGVLQTGWITDATGVYYADETGALAVSETLVDGTAYLFAPNGRLQTGWQTVGDVRRYYAPDTGQPVNGWFFYRDGRYYIDPLQGKLVGEQLLAGQRLAFDAYGCQIVGRYQFADGAVLQYAADGTALTGWQKLDGQTYYFAADGVMQTGLLELPEGVYSFAGDGIMQTGLVTIDGEQVLFAADGKRAAGFTVFDGKTYYCTVTGEIVRSWMTDTSGTYFFDADGVMTTGWLEMEGERFYFSEQGVMQTGIVTVNGVRYAFDHAGKLASGGQVLWDGQTYVCAEDGRILTGWQTIDGVPYYFLESGVRATNTTVDGFVIGADGTSETVLQNTVQQMLPEVGQTPDAVYRYCTGHYRYRHMEETRPLSELSAAGWEPLVAYTVQYHNGVCYYLAATMDYFLQQLGMTTRLVYANHDTGDHYWCQVYYDDAWHNFDPTYSTRGDIAWDAIIAAGKYTVYGYVQIAYDARGCCLGATFAPV